jgi:hypothetical protein
MTKVDYKKPSHFVLSSVFVYFIHHLIILLKIFPQTLFKKKGEKKSR